MDYAYKELKMVTHLDNYQSPTGFRSSYKAVPIQFYDFIKSYIDFTKYYVVFRGPRKRGACSTLKRDAKAFDVYKRDKSVTKMLRIEQEAFWRGVNYAENR